jgi:uncharacterized damage-inducible protein DinB
MDIRQILLRGFRYDLWANRIWVVSLGVFDNPIPAQLVLEHILTAQRVWLDRCGMVLFPDAENVALSELFSMTNQAWRALLETVPLDATITYRNSEGVGFQQPLVDIALHVINHGTYHRGQLRGLAQAEGLEDFPETDLIAFLRAGDG